MFILSAFPASFKTFFYAAVSHLAKRWPSTVFTSFSVAEFNNCAKDFIACVVVFECFPKVCVCEKMSKFVVFVSSEFFSQVSCKVSYFSGVSVAVKAAKTSIGYQLGIIFFVQVEFSFVFLLKSRSAGQPSSRCLQYLHAKDPRITMLPPSESIKIRTIAPSINQENLR